MSKNRNNTTEPQFEDVPDTPTAPQETEKPKFVFADYMDNTGANDASDYSELLKPGMDVSPYSFAWIRYDQHERATRRYFTQCRFDNDAAGLFKPEAFNEQHGVIGRGYEYMSPNAGGIPELSLWRRPKEAAIEEERQMSAASARRLDPEHNAKLKEVQDKIGKAVGMEHVRGGFSFSREGSWD